MNLEDFTAELNEKTKDHPLPYGHKYAISQYADNIIQKGASNYSLTNITTYLNARDCYISVSDILCQHYSIKSIQDAHKVIERLLDIYKCRISPMNKVIGCIYTPATKEQASLSIKTFLAVMEYFKCDVKITKNE